MERLKQGRRASYSGYFAACILFSLALFAVPARSLEADISSQAPLRNAYSGKNYFNAALTNTIIGGVQNAAVTYVNKSIVSNINAIIPGAGSVVQAVGSLGNPMGIANQILGPLTNSIVPDVLQGISGLSGITQGLGQMSSLYSSFSSLPNLSSMLPTQEIANQVIGLLGSTGLPTDALLSQMKGSWSADAQCVPVVQACACGTVPCKGGCCGGLNKFLCPCWDITFGFKTAGICVADSICKAVSFMDIFGKTSSVGDTAEKPSGSSLTSNALQSTASGGCNRYYTVGVRTSDPCAIYVPPTSSAELSQDNSSQLINSFRSTDTSSLFQTQTNRASTPEISVFQTQTNRASTPDISASKTQAQAAGGIGSPVPSPGPVQSRDEGGIRLTSTSATIQTGARNAQLNSESAGFFGYDVPQNAQPQGFVERMCLVRPWQSPLVSLSIPASLFDNICSSKNLSVGILPEAESPQPVRISAKPDVNSEENHGAVISQQEAPITQPGPRVPPRVYIKASPTSVSLGSRSTISWGSQGVESCSETSLDGSFNSNTLRGESSTVPISSATVFRISCIAPDGSRVSDSVTVNLAI